jgi:acyl carrier protein
MLERIQKVFREVLEDDTLVLEKTSSQDNMNGWDSLVQVKLIIGLEEEFGVEFTTEEVLEAHSVGAFEKLLQSKGVS